MIVDLNSDLGEGGANDATIMPLITSANIACAGHAGDVNTMRNCVALAMKHGVSIGAHPGFVDREHFGRRELPITPRDAGQLVLKQTAELTRIAAQYGASVSHVKLHGALYNMASRDVELAAGILEALRTLPFAPALFVLSGSPMAILAREIGIMRVVREVFADRTYQGDGSLTPRGRPGAMIDHADDAAAQVVRMIDAGVVRSVDGHDVPIVAESVCVHGDGPHAVSFAQRLRQELEATGVAVLAPGR